MLKNKKFALLLVVMLVIVPMVFVACGDDDKDEKSDGGDSVALNQTFESESGLTVKYPEGWATQDDGMPMIANSEAALSADEIGDDMAAVMFMAFGADEMAGMGVKETFEMMSGGMASELGEGGEASDVQEVRVAGKDGYRVDIKDSESEGFVIGFETEDGALVVGIGVAGSGKLSNFESTLLAIIESATYSAPVAE